MTNELPVLYQPFVMVGFMAGFFILVWIMNFFENIYRRHKRKIFFRGRKRFRRNKAIREKDSAFQRKLVKRAWGLEDELTQIRDIK